MRFRPPTWFLGSFIGAVLGVAVGIVASHLVATWFPKPSQALCDHARYFPDRPIWKSCDDVRPIVKELVEAKYLRRRGQPPVFSTDTADMLATYNTEDGLEKRWQVRFVSLGKTECSFHIQVFSPLGFRRDHDLQWETYKRILPKATKMAHCDQDGCLDYHGTPRWLTECK